MPSRGKRRRLHISIHALREESDCRAARRPNGTSEFQSTPSARRATPRQHLQRRSRRDISIHALREESDAMRTALSQSRRVISIHALREESDLHGARHCSDVQHFNPRPPRGERHAPTSHSRRHQSIFQSTPSARRATRSSPLRWMSADSISIHALREESDSERRSDRCQVTSYFNPRPPRGERRASHRRCQTCAAIFQSTPSARRATMTVAKLMRACIRFQSTPSARRATMQLPAASMHRRMISIHALREESDVS